MKTEPTRPLLHRKPGEYVPSWLMKPVVRYTLPVLRGHYGLTGHYRNNVPEGDAHETK